MKKKTVILVVVMLGLLGIVAYFAPKIDRFLDVDACLDAGGRTVGGDKCEYADGRIEKM